MQTILTVLHLFLAIGLIALVLMQHGKGADAGAAFGSGASGTVFGASGAGNFLSRSTAILAALFFITSIALGYFSMQKNTGTDLMKDLGQNAPTKAVSDKPLDLPQVQLKPVAAGETPDTHSAPPPPADIPQVQPTSAPPASTPIDVPQVPSATSQPAPTQEEPQAAAPKPADPEPAPAAEPSVQVEPSAKTEDNDAPQPAPTPVQEEVVGTVIEQTPAASEIKPANTGSETATGSTTETAPAAPATDAK